MSHTNENTISRYDSQNGRYLDATSVPKGPTFFIPRSDIAYVVSTESNLLVEYDLNTASVSRSYRTGVEPFYASISRLGRVAYVTNKGEDTISVVDLLNGLSTIVKLPIGSQPEGCKLTARDEYLLVAASGLGSLLFINTTSMQLDASIAVGNKPSYVDLADDGIYAFVTNYGDGTLSVINTENKYVYETVRVGSNPSVVRVFGPNLFVSNEQSGTITVAQILP